MAKVKRNNVMLQKVLDDYIQYNGITSIELLIGNCLKLSYSVLMPRKARIDAPGPYVI